LPRPSSPL